MSEYGWCRPTIDQSYSWFSRQNSLLTICNSLKLTSRLSVGTVNGCAKNALASFKLSADRVNGRPELIACLHQSILFSDSLSFQHVQRQPYSRTHNHRSLFFRLNRRPPFTHPILSQIPKAPPKTHFHGDTQSVSGGSVQRVAPCGHYSESLDDFYACDGCEQGAHCYC